MQKLNDLSRSLTPLEPDGTLIAVIEMSLSSWLVAGIVPGVERQLGYKMAKYVMRIEAIDGFGALGLGRGGFWEDRGYEWYAGI